MLARTRRLMRTADAESLATIRSLVYFSRVIGEVQGLRVARTTSSTSAINFNA